MNRKKLVIFTSNFTGVQVSVIDFLLSKGIKIEAIIFDNFKKEDTQNFLEKTIRKFSWIIKKWGDFRLIFHFFNDFFERKYIRRKLIRISKKRFCEINNIYEISQEYNVPIIEITDINSSEGYEVIKDINPDLGFCLASRILKPNIFNIPKLGTINLHSMKLPEFRGLSPIGFRETLAFMKNAELYIHFIEETLDTGPIILSKKINLERYNWNLNILNFVAIRRSRLLALHAIQMIYNEKYHLKKIDTVKKIYTNPTKKEMLDFFKAVKKIRNAK